MIKYINLPISLLKFDMKLSTKILFRTLVVLTRKGTVFTTVSNLYLGDLLLKTDSQISLMLKELKERKFIIVSRGLGRRQIKLNSKPLKEAGLLTDLRPRK